jgi:hypothetical protein
VTLAHGGVVQVVDSGSDVLIAFSFSSISLHTRHSGQHQWWFSLEMTTRLHRRQLPFFTVRLLGVSFSKQGYLV